MFKYILPTYPVPNKDTGNWEFNDLESLSSLEEFVGPDVQSNLGEALVPGIPMRHQRAVSRLMSGASSIRELMLIHDMGTGKTASSIFSVEKNLGDVLFGMRRGLVLTPGPGVRRNFINELETTIPQYSNRRWVNFYKFYTFETFAQSIKELSNESVRQKWNSTFIIIDEAHLLGYPSMNKDKPSKYDRIAHFINTLTNRKLLILTGTPARDNAADFGNVFNLMIREKNATDECGADGSKVSNKLEVMNGSHYFLDKYLPVGPDGNRRISDELLQKIAGKVSYLAGDPSDVVVNYVGKSTTNVNGNIVTSEMSQFQAKRYAAAMNYDQKQLTENACNPLDKDVAYQYGRQASRFVFPDGTYGAEGFDIHMSDDRKREKLKDLIRAEIKKSEPFNIEDIYGAVAKFSKKYADMAFDITMAAEKEEKSFVYDKFVEGSGLKVFALVLEMFGFKPYSPNSPGHKRYAILTGENSSRIRSILRTFNDPVNVKGKNIMVLLGSDVMSTSHTLKDVIHEHVSPHWNDSETSQVIARGIRTGSHMAYKASVHGPVTVNVYKRASLYPLAGEFSNPDEKFSVDIMMYNLSETKKHLADFIIDAAKKSAITCRAFAKRNRMNPSALDESGFAYNNESDSCNFPKTLTDYNYENVAAMGIWDSAYMKTICGVLMDMKIGTIESFESRLQQELGRRTDRKLNIAYLAYIIRNGIILNSNDSAKTPRYILHDLNGILYIGTGADMYNDAYMCQYTQRYVHSRVGDDQGIYESYLTDFADMYLAERLQKNDFPDIWEVPPKIIQTLIQDCLTTAILGENRAPEGTSWDLVRGVLMKYTDFWASPIELHAAAVEIPKEKLSIARKKLADVRAKERTPKNVTTIKALTTKVSRLEKEVSSTSHNISKIIGAVWYLNNVTNDDTSPYVLHQDDFDRRNSTGETLSAYQLWKPVSVKDSDSLKLISTAKAIQRSAKERIADIKNLQYIGLVNPNSGDFCLSDLSMRGKKRKNSEEVDKRSLHVGKICKFYPKEVVDDVYRRVVDKAEQDDAYTREKKCEQIKRYYKNLNLNSLDLNCGTQLKSRQ